MLKKPAWDVAVIGAGAAGMMAASEAARRGLRVVLIEHASRLAEKIRISGGGRCNFTNVGTTPAQYISQNPHFVRSALAAYTPAHFLELMRLHGLSWHEKHKGQLFCDQSSQAIIAMLKAECDKGQVSWRMPCSVDTVEKISKGFKLFTSTGQLECRQLVLATGGMAMPQLQASDFSLRIARQFGLKIVEPRPALVPLLFSAEHWQPFSQLSGMSLEVEVSTEGDKPRNKKKRPWFLEDLLFTHRGLSGPAILQISSYWEPGQSLTINLATQYELEHWLLEAKQGGRQQVLNQLAQIWPRRLAEQWLNALQPSIVQTRLADLPDKTLRHLADSINRWQITPSGTAGYKKAEVMRGGVDTRNIDQKTMQVKTVEGLYIIGEALDVTGWLGGYNFQWAWASAVACGRALN